MDCFSLSLRFDHDMWHLHGSSCVGDNIEDEWFIVWILLQITAKFRNTTAAVSDSDGEFLLIEASDVIPSWLKPETAVNRVFIRHGKVHVIPLPTHPADLLYLPLNCSLLVALNIMVTSNISEDVVETQGSTICTFNPAIDDVIASRLHDYPAKPLGMARHMVRLRLPNSAAFLLRLCPQSVSSAVRAFYFRDPAEFQAAQKFEAFGVPSRENSCDSMVQFSRCLYAMATKQPFYPPKGISLPHASSRDYLAAELGLKICIGLEILHFRQVRPPLERALFTCCSPLLLNRILAKKGSSYIKVETNIQSIGPETRRELLANSDFGIYFKRLKMYCRCCLVQPFQPSHVVSRRGFFDGELEGSARYKQLLDTSMINFVRTHASRADDIQCTFLDLVSECITLSNLSIINCAFVPPEVPLGPDDDCSWIHVDPAQLDEIMHSKSHSGSTKGESASVDYKLAREKLEQIAAAAESDDESDDSNKSGSEPEHESIRIQLRNEGADKMEKIVSGLNVFVERLSTIDGADTGSEEMPTDNSVEFNAMLAFSKLGDAVGIEEEELFAAMQQKGWGTVDELLTLKALTDLNMNTGEGMFDGSDDESFSSDFGVGHHEGDDPDHIELHCSDPSCHGSSIAELQTAMDNELFEKARDIRTVWSGKPVSSGGHDTQSTDDDQEAAPHLEPVDIDTNLLENIMESIRAQHGEAGPAGALLGLLNIAPPVEDPRLPSKYT
jgi:hypothetical protein